jgi:hypothetical protein
MQGGVRVRVQGGVRARRGVVADLRNSSCRVVRNAECRPNGDGTPAWSWAETLPRWTTSNACSMGELVLVQLLLLQ